MEYFEVEQTITKEATISLSKADLQRAIFEYIKKHSMAPLATPESTPIPIQLELNNDNASVKFEGSSGNALHIQRVVVDYKEVEGR